MIYCGIASIPERRDNLRKVIRSLLPQVDKIFVGLNNYDKMPNFLHDKKIETFLLRNEYGDAAKFLHVEKCDGYYVSWDDDLVASSNSIKRLKEGVDKYNGVVSFHGRKYPVPAEDFKKWIGNYRCLYDVNFDVDINLVGSGCCMFNTKSMKLKLSDFEKPNMADLYLSRVAYEQEVPMIVLSHKRGEIIYLKPTKGKTIWQSTKDFTEHTEILKSYLK